jgi:hypothetical protein
VNSYRPVLPQETIHYSNGLLYLSDGWGGKVGDWQMFSLQIEFGE